MQDDRRIAVVKDQLNLQIKYKYVLIDQNGTKGEYA